MGEMIELFCDNKREIELKRYFYNSESESISQLSWYYQTFSWPFCAK